MATAIQEKKIEELVERTVFRILNRLIADPDFGLELRPDFERKLKKAIVSMRAGRLKSFSEVTEAL